MDRSGQIRTFVLSTLLVLFWCGIFWFFYRTLDYFRTIPDLGPVLSQKLLSMVFLTFFAILLFSNVITSLSHGIGESDSANNRFIHGAMRVFEFANLASSSQT